MTKLYGKLQIYDTLQYLTKNRKRKYNKVLILFIKLF